MLPLCKGKLFRLLALPIEFHILFLSKIVVGPTLILIPCLDTVDAVVVVVVDAVVGVEDTPLLALDLARTGMVTVTTVTTVVTVMTVTMTTDFTN